MKILLLAIRSLMRFRLYTVINILGLALSLACVIIISRYVYSEATTDHFCTNHERVYLSVRHWPDGKLAPMLFTSDNVLIKKNYQDPLDIPEIEQRSSFVSLADVTIGVDEKKFSTHVLATDSNFLQILDYPVIEGNRNQLLTDPKGAVITLRFARKLFGQASPVGKNIQYNEHLLTIQGVVGEAETASSFHFDLLICKGLQWRWPPVNFHSIALAVPGCKIEQLNEKIKTNYYKAGNNSFFFQVLPLDKLYLDKAINRGENENTFRQGNPDSLKILSLVAFLLLLVGTFNFIHISAVVLMKRGREMGMKKVFGAHPRQLFIQLYLENLVLTGIALLIGWCLTEITQNLQENLLGITIISRLSFNLLLSASFLFGLPLLITVYPFFSYCYRHTITSLKGIIPEKRKMSSRSLFLVIQYCITCCLIISSLFFMKQLNFMLHADLGYQTKDIIKAWFLRPSSTMMITKEDTQQANSIYLQTQEAIKSTPLFNKFCFGIAPYEIRQDQMGKSKARIPGNDWQELTTVSIPYQFFNFFGIPVPTNQIPGNEKEVLLNETARQLLGLKKDQSVDIEIERYGQGQSCLVKGVTPEFQVVHLSQHNIPIVMFVGTDEVLWPDKLMASVAPGRRREAIQFLKELHNKTVGGEFEYTFVEDEIAAIYEKDKLVAHIYSVFTLIAIIISSLGLFSLSLFDIQQRYKEIAIRKVNGATTGVITALLLRKYYRLLGISFLIATPLSWLAITQYMEDFVHKAPVSWWIFAIAFLITSSISLFTLLWQIRKAAGTNPAIAIQTE